MAFKKLVVFDLDGTLNRTELFAVPAHQKALAELGITDRTDQEIIDTFGARSEDSTGDLIRNDKQEAIEAYLKKVSQYERDFMQIKAGSFEGVPQMLAKLKEDGYLTAVCSNASERYIRLVLATLQIEDKIDEVQHLVPGLTKDETLELLLARIKPDKAVMVGDRIYDKNAAQKNGLPFIGCLYGFKSGEVADADIAVDSPAKINDAVKALIG